MNRREEKKLETFAAIVRAADSSFDRIGYEETAIESIAQDAGVSPGTVYNYFGTKNAILATIVTQQTDDIMREAGQALDLDASDPISALMPMIKTYIDQMSDYGPILLKEVFRAGFEPAQSGLLADFVSSDERVIAQLADALKRMQPRGLVALHVDPGPAALLVYSVVAVALMMFVAVPGMTSEEVNALARGQILLVFEGLGARDVHPNG
jgi:AcrR family transcriptional regulator